MTTTHLIVELLIIGFGAVVWLVLLAASIFNYTFQNILPNINSAILPPIIGISYVLGVIIDRIAYSLFARLDRKNKDKIITSDNWPEIYFIERHVINNSEAFKNQILYNRSRLRICRSWIINFTLIAITFAIWAYKVINLVPIVILIFSLLCISLSVLTFFVWYKLSEDHYKNLKESYGYLKEGNL